MSTGVFDSGVGGMSVLREATRLLPSERFIYYADSGNCPYGGKSQQEVIGRSRLITEFLLEKGASMIVVACNTATAAAISTLREEWPDIPFVGIEPAVKPAALGTRSGVIGVLATAGTLKGSNYLDLRGKWSDAEGIRIVESVGRGFVELVEKGITSGPQAEQVVRASVEPLLKEGADTIVLGCTHYPFLSDVIRKIAGPQISVIDPAPAVAAQIGRLRNAVGGSAGKNASGTGGVTIFSSGDEAFARSFWEKVSC